MIFIPFLIFVALLFGYFFYKHYSHKLKRQKAFNNSKHLKIEWQSYLKENSNLYQCLDQENKEDLIKAMLTFYGEKYWHEKLDANERLLTSLYACLPIFKRKTNFYPNITEIKVFSPFEKWLSYNEKQFELDYGKMALKELRGNFASFSKMYFESYNEFKEGHPNEFQKLQNFYQLEL